MATRGRTRRIAALAVTSACVAGGAAASRSVAHAEGMAPPAATKPSSTGRPQPRVSPEPEVSAQGVRPEIVPLPARTQVRVGLVVGPALASDGEGRLAGHVELHLGLRADLLWWRAGPRDFGLGPFVEVATFAFDQGQFGAGLSALLPVHEAFPLVVSGGGHARIARDDLGPQPGFDTTLFWGARSFNHHGAYNLAGGLRVGYHHSFGVASSVLGTTVDEKIFSVAADLDGALLVLPFIYLVEALGGPSDDAAVIE
ncbi:MAG: hypothetical protein AAF928_02510 [Myxococcota bacterium]